MFVRHSFPRMIDHTKSAITRKADIRIHAPTNSTKRWIRFRAKDLPRSPLDRDRPDRERFGRVLTKVRVDRTPLLCPTAIRTGASVCVDVAQGQMREEANIMQTSVRQRFAAG